MEKASDGGGGRLGDGTEQSCILYEVAVAAAYRRRLRSPSSSSGRIFKHNEVELINKHKSKQIAQKEEVRASCERRALRKYLCALCVNECMRHFSGTIWSKGKSFQDETESPSSRSSGVSFPRSAIQRARPNAYDGSALMYRIFYFRINNL